MSKRFWLISVLIILTCFIAGGVFARRTTIIEWYDEWLAPELPEPITRVNTNTSSNSAAPSNLNTGPGNTNTVVPQAQPLPAEMNLAVPFTSQAPHANWELPYQEACEEAASLMVHYFWADQTFASKEEADREIRALVDFQETKYGFYKDSTAEETARFIRAKWNYDTVEVVTGASVTIDRIKREIADGYPVIAFAAGQQLGNPNFRGDGPLYHALVIKGYTKDGKFITNDPGTRNGADYTYSETTLLKAIHDWNNGDPATGQKAIIIVRPN